MTIPTLADYPQPPTSPKPPLFSIVTVVRNNAVQLAQTMESLLQQTYQDFEYIIVDGNSQDDFLTVVQKYSDPRISWVSESDQGIYDAMNKGIARSQGTIIGTLNAGDFYLPQTLELVAKAYQSAANSELIIAGDIQVSNKQNLSHLTKAAPGWSRLYFSLHQPALFVTKNIYQKYGLFDTTYRIAGDYEFFLRIYTAVEKVFVGKTLTHTSPPGASGNYYAATLESHRARLASNYPWLIAWLVTAIKLLRVAAHLFLEKVKIWQILEHFRHRFYAKSIMPGYSVRDYEQTKNKV
jgi:glycosyltransferase involved in cell wall biosynthesis